MTTGNPVFLTFENLGMFLLGALITLVLLGGLFLGWRAGLRDKRRHHQQLQQRQGPQAAPRTGREATLASPRIERTTPQAVTGSESERLLQRMLARGEIDQATYERELDEVRRREAA